MAEFNAHTLREKFVLTDPAGQSPDIIALSNRMKLSLSNDEGKVIEEFVVRAQMGHVTVRLVGLILNAFERTGPLLKRHVPFNWNEAWDKAAGAHEKFFNPDLWGCVYTQGKPLFFQGARHPLLDVIEQVDHHHQGDYEDSVHVAEEMFARAGKPMQIKYESGISATFKIGDETGKCGLILRDAAKTATFVFHGDKRDLSVKALSPVGFINTSAAFLEGVQLSFVVGQGNEKLRQNVITLYSPEERALTSARTRLAELGAAIRSFENNHNVYYRPDKPSFAELITKAEKKIAQELADSVF